MLNYSITLILYNYFLSFLVPYLVTNATRLGLSTAYVAQLNTYWTNWQAAYTLYMNPATYGPVNTGNMNDLYALVLPYTAGMKQSVKSNPSVTLTTMDYIVLAIHKNLGKHGNLVAPTQQAGVSVKFTSHLNVAFHVYDLEHPTRGAKPPHVYRITPFMLLLPHGSPAPTIDQLVEMEDVTRMTFDVPFSTLQQGLDGYMAVCFTNDAGQGTKSGILPFSII